MTKQPLNIFDESQFEKVEKNYFRQKDITKFSESILEDGSDKIFMPETFRLFNSYECSQLFRFWIVVNWMREIHEKQVKIENVLDLGCSHSKLYQMWYNNGNFFNWPHINYYGVDADEKRLLKGRKNLKHKKADNIIHILGDISYYIKFPIKFQIIVSMETFEHIPKDRLKYLFKTAYKNLSNEGSFIISGENPDRKSGETGVYRNSNETHHYEWPYEEVIELAKETGFKLDIITFYHAKKSYRSSDDKLLKKMYNNMKKILPTSIVNNLCCMLDTINPYNGKQWMMKLSKSK